jgi:quercetin dioxygenase-like cupin family protein
MTAISGGVSMKSIRIGMIAMLALAPLPSTAMAQGKFVVTPLAERKVAELPAGPLYWRIENFTSLAQARAAVGPWALAVESAGKAWLFTLGPRGGASNGASRVAEIGPIAPVVAHEYLLRINEGSGPPGSKTPVHSHPGSEAFYVLDGETTSRTADGVMRVEAGQSEPGHAPNTPMQVSSSGSTDLQSLVMFVVDADKPFSSPARLP